MRSVRRTAAVAVAVLLAAAAWPAVGPMPAAQAGLFSISEQQEIQIGREVERQLSRKPGFLDDPVLTQNLADVGHRLAAVSERPNLPWTYHVLRDGSVNAIAAPGGFVFATRGLFGFIRSQDELAFVIGHETTHVAHRHAVELAQQDLELQFGAAILTQVVFGGSWSAAILGSLGEQMVAAKFSRDKEYEADHYGVIYAREAGFDPTRSIAFFDRLRRQEKTQPGLAHAFEDHPDTAARIAALCTELTGFGYHVDCPVAPGPMTPPSRPSPVSPVPERN
jgi:predicted Zn-dependent protease